MKLVECMEDNENLHAYRGESKSEVTQKNNVNLSNGNKGWNKWEWAEGKP
jgi:hypothetical protein